MNCRQNSISSIRRGFTVVELLIVMAIIVILAAVTLPTIRGLLTGQKISEAARIVKGYAEAAKARSISTGRPVALILNRLRADAISPLATKNTCVRMSLGDVFPPYQGDYAGAQGQLVDFSGDGFADQIHIDVALAATLTSLVSPGDLIELGDRRERFFISAAATNGMGQVVVEFNNPSLTVNAAQTQNIPLHERAWPIGTAGGPMVSFRILRKPSKSLASGVSLPRGTCIDLQFSGVGQTGREMSSDFVQGGLSDSPGIGLPDFGPIYIVFTPDGRADTWYTQSRPDATTTVFTRAPVQGLVHLLVGATDQVVDSGFDLSSWPNGAINAAAMTDTDDYKTNIMDENNSWVTINPNTGGITTSTVQSTTVPLSGIHANASLLDQRVAQARSLATNALSEITQ